MDSRSDFLSPIRGHHRDTFKMRTEKNRLGRRHRRPHFRRARHGVDHRLSDGRLYVCPRHRAALVDLPDPVRTCDGRLLDMLFQGALFGRSLQSGGGGQIERDPLRPVCRHPVPRRTQPLGLKAPLSRPHSRRHLSDNGHRAERRKGQTDVVFVCGALRPLRRGDFPARPRGRRKRRLRSRHGNPHLRRVRIGMAHRVRQEKDGGGKGSGEKGTAFPPAFGIGYGRLLAVLLLRHSKGR